MRKSSTFAILSRSSNRKSTLRRITTRPRLDFVILPLSSTEVPEIEKAIQSKIAFNGDRGIIHVPIETDGQIAFGGYDNFHRDCLVVNSVVPVQFLDDLVKLRVLRKYSLVDPSLWSAVPK